MLSSFQGEPNLFSGYILHRQNYSALDAIHCPHHQDTRTVAFQLKRLLPLTLRKLVVQLVFAVGVEVEDALNEVLAEHFWVLLEQHMEQTVFTQAGRDRS